MARTFESNLYYRNNYSSGAVRRPVTRSRGIRKSSRSFVGVFSGKSSSNGRPSSRPRINRARAFANTGAVVGSNAGKALKETTNAFAQAISVAKNLKGGVRKFEIGPGTVMIGMMGFALLLSLTYLVHFNQVATKGYELRRLEADRQQLMSQYEIKNMRLAEVKALSYISDSDTAKVMRRPGEVSFVRGNTAIASR